MLPEVNRQATLLRTLFVLLFGGVQLATNDCLAAGPKQNGPEIRFSQQHGFFERPFTVEITTKTPGAKIYFTTNGAGPTERAGSLYTAPLKITTTTILRASAFSEGLEPSDTGTQTYLFLKDISNQTGAGFSPTWGTNQGKAVSADYEMDPEIVNHPAYRDELVPALKSIPTMSVAMAPADLFEAERGIYANPQQSGGTDR